MQVSGSLLLPFQGEGDHGVGTTGAADGERSFFLAVEIEEIVPLRKPLASLLAPVNPVSSSTVNRNSSGPWTSPLSSMIG